MPEPADADPLFPPPRCIVVTGPRGAGKTRWLQERIRAIQREDPAARCALVLAEDGRTRMERFARETPNVSVHRVFLPCLCCPALADLPGAARALVASNRADWLFLELPALAASGLLAEFDRALGWPRKVRLILDAEWSAARVAGNLSPFHAALLEIADEIETPALPSSGG